MTTFYHSRRNAIIPFLVTLCFWLFYQEGQSTDLHCSEHSLKQLTQAIDEYHQVYNSEFVLDPVTYSYLYNKRRIPNCFTNPRLFKNSSQIRKFNLPLSRTSYICPWKYMMTMDENRLPNRIIEVKCLRSQKCRFKKRCRIKKLPHPVLRRKNENSEWQATIEYITVGCYCQKKRRRPQKKKKTYYQTQQCPEYYKRELIRTIKNFIFLMNDTHPLFSHHQNDFFYNKPSCLRQFKGHKNDKDEFNIGLRDLRSAFCQTEFVYSIDGNRRPETITDVKCSSKRKCRKHGCKCVKLNIFYPVLRRLKPGYQWYPGIEKVGVACVCKI